MDLSTNTGWVSDFETTTTPDRVRVWLWGSCKISDPRKFVWGTDIESWLQWALQQKKIYFHNLKFDGSFILYHLLKNDWKRVDAIENKVDHEPGCFVTSISNKGIWYSITLLHLNGKTVIWDSLKKLPFSVKQIAKSFKLEMAKGEINYTKNRPFGYSPTAEEIDYVRKDVQIVAKALNSILESGLRKMTRGSDALFNYKKTIGDKFDDYFPQLSRALDKELRCAYKGGWTYLRKDFAGIDIRQPGCVYDTNSMYPYVQRTKPMPIGKPVYFDGEYVPDKSYPLYIIKFEAMFSLRKETLPTIQVKGSGFYNPVDYIEESVGMTMLTLTNIDYELFLTHYHVYEIKFHYGWKFKCATGLFDEYIDHWTAIKAESTGAQREMAKLMLNSLYGKFAKNPDVTQKYPYIQDDILKMLLPKETEYSDTLYLPVGAYITAYAREKIITSAQENYSRFIYADTDSLHLLGLEEPNLEIHRSKLGAWKLENTFRFARFIRPKRYIEVTGYHIKVTCAGMPDNVKKQVRISNFKTGHEFNGKLQQRQVPGGACLLETTFRMD